MSVRTVSTRVWRTTMVGLGAAALLIGSSPASAQQLNKKTSVRFNVPVEIPGVGAQVLPPGDYVFRLADSLSDRHIVQIFNKDESHIYATILTIPNRRLRATDKTVMTFAERAAGDPQAIRAWFYPGETSGHEFVYPRKRALELARLTHQPVVYIPDELAPDIVAPVRTIDDAPVVALKEAPLRAFTPAGQDVPIADVIEAPPTQVASLPRTASAIPGIFLVGLLCLAAGFAMKATCART
jgi:hypothetical protein